MHAQSASQLCHHILVFTFVIAAISCTITKAQTVSGRYLTDTTPINLTSPNYPNHYPNNLNFAYHITVPDGCRILAKFHFLSLESNSDFLSFGDGIGRELIRLTGRYSPPTILSPANVMWMNFTSDASSSDIGFQFEISLYNKSGVRLVDGTTVFNGRVEVYTDSYGWGTVSSLRWNLKDASTVCKELGLPGAISEVTNAYYGPGTGVVVMTNVDCSNDIFRLQDCNFQSPCSACPHSQDAGVNCHRPNYLGCYNLPNLQSGSSTAKSVDACISKCDQASMRYAAVNGDKCFCRSDMTLPESPEDDSMCDRQCSENQNQACGSSHGSSIFTVYDTEFAKCNDPDIPENSTRTGNSFQFGSKLKYNCSEGFDLIGSWEITCVEGISLQDPVWDHDVPECIARVENTTQPTNTTALPQEELPNNDLLNILTIVLVVVFSFIFLVILLCCICRCRKKGRCKRKPKKTEMWY
ncbi:deleted in malignant brain tumors 1 protein-like [Lytechinus pictus]|uniref:deleted in malignant brain tumors 1 protein-like n=1 Tax=Lytechinus pictus TaxID=7653 RepID=UPI0030B9FD46